MCCIQRNLTLVMFPSVQTCQNDLFKLLSSPCNLIVIEDICYWVNVILPGYLHHDKLQSLWFAASACAWGLQIKLMSALGVTGAGEAKSVSTQEYSC